jgi:diguanylate cyclase (GGDEF)-like protein
MMLFRRRSVARATESASALSLPRVRMGFLTKLNLLTIGLIFLTAAGTTGFYVWQQWRDETADLRQRGASALLMLSELSEFGLYTGNRAYLEAILSSLPAEGDIAYAAVVDRSGETVAVRRIKDALGPSSPPPLTEAPMPVAGATSASELTIRGKRYVELIAPVRGEKIVSAMGLDQGPPEPKPAAATNGKPASTPEAGKTLGYVRVGMTFDRVQQQFRKHLIGAFSVIALLIGLTIGATFLLTRSLVAPMHRLMRAARAVGGGKLDVFVPPRSTDELGALTHAFNHMTQRLSESQAEVANYQRTLEEKVAQRTHELEIATAHAYKLAQHDILTGLPNRALLNQRLKQILALSQRNGTHVACLFLDFDHFKRINDTLGHDSGDQLLQAVSQRLIAAVRESDTVARLGGDEFVVILPGLDPAHATFETMTVLARIRESFLTPFKLADQTPTLTCSIGVSMFPLDANDTVTLIKQADTAMYAAKEVGRNAYRFYTADMNARVQARLQLETDMRRGLLQNEFFLAYQPQVDLQTGRTRAVEALIRWRDPSRGVIPPSEFIPIAEESGMIHGLGARVLRDACRQLVAWHRLGMMLRLSVNLSVQQLQHDSCLAVVDEALRGSGLAPQYLDLEITESVIISHPEKAVATLVKLKERGISITVDDFGTGYSSLSYLATLPIEALKIDQRFVHGLEHNSNDVAITQAIIALSHSLGLRVIAEGVETRAQFSFLKNHGCESAQGFLIGRPLEEKEFLAWWKAQDRETRSVTLQPDMWQPEGG